MMQERKILSIINLFPIYKTFPQLPLRDKLVCVIHIFTKQTTLMQAKAVSLVGEYSNHDPNLSNQEEQKCQACFSEPNKG